MPAANRYSVSQTSTRSSYIPVRAVGAVKATARSRRRLDRRRSRRGTGQLQRDELEVLRQPVRSELPPDTGLLETTERREHVEPAAVHRHLTGPEPPCDS